MKKTNIVHGTLTLEEGLSLFKVWQDERNLYKEECSLLRHKKDKAMVLGVPVKKFSDRYPLFLENHTCVNCGLVASYFLLEKAPTSKSFHINMYGTDKNGLPVMYTKDHIRAKANGGANCHDNYQVMCADCNVAKGASDTCDEVVSQASEQARLNRAILSMHEGTGTIIEKISKRNLNCIIEVCNNYYSYTYIKHRRAYRRREVTNINNISKEEYNNLLSTIDNSLIMH